MEAMEDFAAQNQVKAVTLEVRSQNTAALKLYKSYGFEEKPESAGVIIMIRRMTP